MCYNSLKTKAKREGTDDGEDYEQNRYSSARADLGLSIKSKKAVSFVASSIRKVGVCRLETVNALESIVEFFPASKIL